MVAVSAREKLATFRGRFGLAVDADDDTVPFWDTADDELGMNSELSTEIKISAI